VVAREQVVRVAVLGTGFWARHAHLPALRSLPGVEVVAAIGRTLDRARAFAAAEGIPAAYASVEEALASRDRPEVLIVAGPDSTHPDATNAALAAGVAVFCEKPLANRGDLAREMAALARRTGVPATVGYSFRYSPAIQALRGDLQSGYLGDPWLLELFEYNSQFHPALGKPMNWKGDPDIAAAGALFEYGSHVVDIAAWLAGPIRAVSTCMTRVLPGARLDDIATLQMRLAGPAVGVLVAGWVLSGSVPGIRIRVHGSRGLGEVEMSQTLPAGQAYRRYGLDGAVREEPALEPLGDEVSGCARRHLGDFFRVVRGQQPSHRDTLPSLDEGARVQEVLDCALSATQCWVNVLHRAELQDAERR
jgi:predicted dehydrogenase